MSNRTPNLAIDVRSDHAVPRGFMWVGISFIAFETLLMHKRDTNLEQGARKVIQLVGKSYCTWPKFMKLPGSKTFAPGSLNYSDGYVGRITNELIRRPGKCKRSQD